MTESYQMRYSDMSTDEKLARIETLKREHNLMGVSVQAKKGV